MKFIEHLLACGPACILSVFFYDIFFVRKRMKKLRKEIEDKRPCL